MASQNIRAIKHTYHKQFHTYFAGGAGEHTLKIFRTGLQGGSACGQICNRRDE